MDNFHSSSILPSASAPTPDGSSGALISDFRASPLQTRAMEYQPGNNPTATPIQRAFNGNYFPFLFRPRLSLSLPKKNLLIPLREFERAVALLVMRSTDLDRAEMILRAAFNQLVNEVGHDSNFPSIQCHELTLLLVSCGRHIPKSCAPWPRT